MTSGERRHDCIHSAVVADKVERGEVWVIVLGGCEEAGEVISAVFADSLEFDLF